MDRKSGIDSTATVNPIVGGVVTSQQVNYQISNSAPNNTTAAATIGAPAANQPGTWSTELFECSRDEESCWWGTWCCWLVAARSVETFAIGKSINEAMLFWAGMIIFLILFIFRIQPLGLFWGVAMFVYFIWRRAIYRYAIREKYHIPGEFANDLLMHGLCSCCAVCQEAREAKFKLLPRLDYCFADSLAEQELIHDRALGRNNSSLSESLVPESGNLLSHLQAVSKTSRMIVVLSAVVCVLSFVALLASGRGANILILLLVFVQPLAILYFVYWRSKRQYALLDFVIKSFAVGFWFTTFQSMLLEMLLQGFLFVTLMPLMTYGENPTGDGDQQGPPPLPPSANTESLGGAVGMHRGTIGRFIFEVMNALHSSSADAVDSYSSSGYNGFYPNEAPTPTTQMDDVAIEEHNKELMRSHFIVVLIALVLMAYVVAAGVEETMKHFIVRCCQFPSPLNNPNTVLIYLMAGALGFATCENIEYVFGQHSSPIPGTTMIVGELLVLLMRVLMPIHVICSVLQAATLSRVIMGEVSMNLFQILLPALFVHGTFDFILFLLSAISYIFDDHSIWIEIMSLVISAAITIGSAYWAYKSFTAVLYRFENGWQQVDNMENAGL